MKIINRNQTDITQFKSRCVGCIILTKDKKIALQRRDNEAPTFPGCLALFGGHMKNDEPPLATLIRELKEELDADVKENEVISLGIVMEEVNGEEELEFVYFWHDRQGTVADCHEGKAKYYKDIASIFLESKIMEDVYWALQECQKRHLLD